MRHLANRKKSLTHSCMVLCYNVGQIKYRACWAKSFAGHLLAM